MLVETLDSFLWFFLSSQETLIFLLHRQEREDQKDRENACDSTVGIPVVLVVFPEHVVKVEVTVLL